MDPIQLVLIIVLIAVAVAIIVCIVYLIFLIREIRNIISKTSAIIDDAHSITGAIARPVSSFSDFLMGFKNGFKLFNKFFDKKDD